MIRVQRTLLRVMVLLAGMLGLLAMFGGAAQAYGGHQHCEPVRRS